jgi:glutathione S-transferase
VGYVLYDFLSSGNGFKCRLTMKALGIPYEYRQRDILAGETRTPEFLAINPNGKIPVLVVPGRGPISESHAIINFLAEGSQLMPADRYERALVWQWLCFEQYQLEPGVATVRFMLHYMNLDKAELGVRYTDRYERGRDALAVLEKGLTGRAWLVGGGVTLADIALFAYTHVADEAGYRFADYPAISAWIAEFKKLPWYSPITAP